MHVVLVGRPEGKRPLGRPRRRWEDIKMDLREVGYDDRDWINLAQEWTDEGLCEGGNEPPVSLKAISPVWGIANKTHKHRLQVLQNKFLRTATNAPWFVRNQQLHQELGILPLEQYIHSMSKSFFNKLPGVPGALTYNIGARSCQPSPLKRKLPQDILLSDTDDSS
ncbi:hypothetical protein ANN_00246 [Periplaneta americana]|uniref:Uncharacterized protein n=1 Tax=Periplaneta americana TaxID=6978 RepID=A0ABQ8TQB1_PERAM|nr:hypothetical protein ANN_00246 [Periplaneta americana]